MKNHFASLTEIPDGSRRDFLRISGVLPAAVATLAGNTPAAAAETLPQIQIGKHSISRLICGTNTFHAISHLSVFIDFGLREFYTLEQIAKTLHRCQEVGINCVQGLHTDEYQHFLDDGGKIQVLANGQGDPAQLVALVKTGCIGIQHFGVTTDTLFRQGRLDTVHEYLKRIRDTGLLVGLTTHMPAVIDRVESQGWDLDYYMTCVYQWGRTQEDFEKLFGARQELVPIEASNSGNKSNVPEIFLRGDPPRMYKAIRQTKKPCLAYKILAAGRKCQTPELVDRAFKEAFENIKPTDAVIVGMFPRYTDQVAENAEYVRRYGVDVAARARG